MHGSKEFRLRMLDCIHEGDPNALKHVDDAEQKKDMSEAAAEAVMLRCLSYFGLRRGELPRMAKSAPEKRLIAGLPRYTFPVFAVWIAQELLMGHYTSVSKAVRFYDQVEGAGQRRRRIFQGFQPDFFGNKEGFSNLRLTPFSGQTKHGSIIQNL